MPISQMLLPEFDQEMASTRKMLARVPENFAFKPHEKSMTLGRLASHVAEIPSWGKETMDKDVLELDASMKPRAAGSKQEILDMFDRNVAGARDSIAAATDDDFLKTWTLKFNGKQMFAMPKIGVMRAMVMNHLIHHRAQLGVYLRLNNVEVPGMYGPSADEANWWDGGKGQDGTMT